jgi:hypothetical protein
MAAITPWVAGLAESELENVIAWKSVVKAEPDAINEDTAPRFSDDGSNLRSFVGSPPLSQTSMLQLLQVPTLRFCMWNTSTDHFSETRLERSGQNPHVGR